MAFSKHSAIIAGFGRHFIKTGAIPEEYHRYLIEGENIRNAGDYDIKTSFTEKDAMDQIERAEKLLKLAELMI